MNKDGYIQIAVYCLFVMALITTNQAAVVDIKHKGAKGDGKTDDGPVTNNNIHVFLYCYVFIDHVYVAGGVLKHI